MSYRLVYTHRAVKDIEALDGVAKKRLAKKLEHFMTDPFTFSERLINSALGQYRFRVGNYRVIFDVHGSDIVILRVGHRREIY